MKDSIRIIKKYTNRRLYDTELAAYITLEDIKKLVLDHVEFKVIDANTNTDLTHATLLQIITEHEMKSTPLFSTHMLQDFIRVYNEKSHSMLSCYLEEALSMFTQQKDFFKKQWSEYQAFFMSPITPSEADVSKAKQKRTKKK